MFTKRKSKVERITRHLSSIVSGFTVFAEEGTPSTPPETTPETPVPVQPPVETPTPQGNTQPTSMNFEEMIARVRKEEKDKLYGEIQRLKGESETLRKSNNAYILQAAGLQKQVEDLQANSDTAALNARIKELEGQLEEAKKAPDEAAIRAQIEAEYKVKLYAQEKLSEHKDEIISSFAAEVTGTTNEEVDAAVQKAIEKSLAIKKELGLVDEEGKPTKGGKKSGRRKTSAPALDNPPPVSNPSAMEDDEFDIEYVRGLDVNSPEYAAFRKKMGLDRK